MRTPALLCLLLLASPAFAAAPQAACDRECLRGKVTQLLFAFVKHDVSGLPVVDTLCVTVDAVEKTFDAALESWVIIPRPHENVVCVLPIDYNEKVEQFRLEVEGISVPRLGSNT